MPGRVQRDAQRLLLRSGLLSYARSWVNPAIAARRVVAPNATGGSLRVLVRVDEFPHARTLDDPRNGREAFERFHAVLAGAGVPYLLAVLPYLARDYLDPDGRDGRPLDAAEAAVLARLPREGVTLALHGRNHRTRDRKASRHSELVGLGEAELEELLDDAESVLLSAAGVRPEVFVPPFNRFDAGQWDLLARRFDVVCGGPESVRLLGWHGSPVWRGSAVYLPSYPPLYGRGAEIRRELERLAAGGADIWAPVVLHPGWELEDDLDELGRLARVLAAHARPWGEFLRAVADSRSPQPERLRAAR